MAEVSHGMNLLQRGQHQIKLKCFPLALYDKSNGEFSCELNDANADSWKRAIQVQVIGKLESVADFKKGVPQL